MAAALRYRSPSSHVPLRSREDIRVFHLKNLRCNQTQQQGKMKSLSHLLQSQIQSSIAGLAGYRLVHSL